MTGPDQLLVASLANAPTTPGTGTDNTVRVGKVQSIAPLTVSLQGGSVVQPGILRGGAVPGVGEPVALIRQDSTWICLGAIDTAALTQRISLTTATAQVSFNNIPPGASAVRVKIKARMTSGGAVAIQCRVNGDTGLFYTYHFAQHNALAAPAAIGGSGSASATLMTCGVVGQSAGAYAGACVEFHDWNNVNVQPVGSNMMPMTFTSSAMVFGVGYYSTWGGGVYFFEPGRQKTSLQFFPDAGAVFAVGSDFLLEII